MSDMLRRMGGDEQRQQTKDWAPGRVLANPRRRRLATAAPRGETVERGPQSGGSPQER